MFDCPEAFEQGAAAVYGTAAVCLHDLLVPRQGLGSA